MFISLLDDITYDEGDNSGDNDDSPMPAVQRDFSGWIMKCNSCPYIAWKQCWFWKCSYIIKYGRQLNFPGRFPSDIFPSYSAS